MTRLEFVAYMRNKSKVYLENIKNRFEGIRKVGSTGLFLTAESSAF